MSVTDDVTVFHHTDKNSANKILKSGKIIKSKDITNDAVAGEGTYVTKYGPDKSRKEIAVNNYDGNSNFYKSKIDEGKTDVVFEMKLPRKEVTDCSKRLNGRDVHRCDDDIWLQKTKGWKVHYREKGSDEYQTKVPKKKI